jgi:hypothetical protein
MRRINNDLQGVKPCSTRHWTLYLSPSSSSNSLSFFVSPLFVIWILSTSVVNSLSLWFRLVSWPRMKITYTIMRNKTLASKRESCIETRFISIACWDHCHVEEKWGSRTKRNFCSDDTRVFVCSDLFRQNSDAWKFTNLGEESPTRPKRHSRVGRRYLQFLRATWISDTSSLVHHEGFYLIKSDWIRILGIGSKYRCFGITILKAHLLWIVYYFIRS